MVPVLLAAALAAVAVKAGQVDSVCSVVKLFVGTAPSDIVQKEFSERFERALSRVDCRDDGLCYQKWGKNCRQSRQ